MINFNILFNIRLVWITKGHHSPKVCLLASVRYRRIQIVVRLTNICYQTHLLPMIQFNGAVSLILLLYSILIIVKYLTIWSKILVYLTFIIGVVIICVVLHTGSQPILKSRNILHHWRIYNQTCDCRWTAKFLRSCPEVVLRMGTFHAMDRSRAPNLMRFVLQRTFFLVKSTGSIKGVSLSLP